MSIKIQPLGPLTSLLTGVVFDFLFPEEIAQIINRVRKSWSAYMSSGELYLSALPITDRDLDTLLLKSHSTYPHMPLTRLAVDHCTQLTSKSGKRISKIQTLTQLNLAESINESEKSIACGLREMPHLTSLDLSGSLEWKPEIIAKCVSLRELILKNCCCDDNVRALAELSLKILDLSDNSEIGPASAVYINNMTCLKELNITGTYIPHKLVKRPNLKIIHSAL
jgi:hypothetical protein